MSLGEETFLPYCGESHEAPPERLYKGPAVAGVLVEKLELRRPTLVHLPPRSGTVGQLQWRLLLGEVGQAGEGQESHYDQQDQQTKLLVGLLQQNRE